MLYSGFSFIVWLRTLWSEIEPGTTWLGTEFLHNIAMFVIIVITIVIIMFIFIFLIAVWLAKDTSYVAWINYFTNELPINLHSNSGNI